MSAKKSIQPNITTVDVKCTGCGATFQLSGAFKDRYLSVEQCENCHSAYTGIKSSTSSGASDKFYTKYKIDLSKFKKKKKTDA